MEICEFCGSDNFFYMGALGNTPWARCIDCGMDHEMAAPPSESDSFEDDDMDGADIYTEGNDFYEPRRGRVTHEEPYYELNLDEF